MVYRFTDDGETIGELSIGTLSNLVRRPRPVSLGSLAQRHPSSSTPVQQMYGFSIIINIIIILILL